MPRLTPTELERLHRCYAAGVYRFCWLATRSREDAEDLLQEFFIKLARTKSGCREPGHERAWVYASARNLTIDWHRKRERRGSSESFEVAESDPSCGSADPDAALLGRELQIALATLPDEQREVAALRLWEGLSLAEIATIQDVPLQTVASRLRYALARLRTELESIYSEIK